MDTMPDDDPMEIPSHTPLAGLDPADLLRQGVAEDTLVDDASRSFTPPLIEELAPLFPQFEIIGLIGQGGMGAVYKVRQKDLDRIVALKILPPAIGQSPTFSSRFAREAKALAKLNHPGIVTIHDFGQADGLYFILMEFVDGVNLAQLMKTGRISPREALAIVPQICDALQYAHDRGIVHRDIKPENILLDRLGRVKVADFGIAKVVAAVCDRLNPDEVRRSQTDATLAGKIIGTPQYMAPEQIEHPSEVDHRADIYALGVVFYQMLTGELPGKELQAPSRKVHIDVRLDEIVLQAMEKNPALRYQQASVMKTRVETIASTPDSRREEARTEAPESSIRKSQAAETSSAHRGLAPLLAPATYLLLVAAAVGWMLVAPSDDAFRGIFGIVLTLPWSVVLTLGGALVAPKAFEGSMLPGILVVLVSGAANAMLIHWIATKALKYRRPSRTPQAGKVEGSSVASQDGIRQLLRMPAIGLIASGVLQIAVCLSLLVFALPAVAREGRDFGGYTAVIFMAALSSIAAAVVLGGGIAMRTLRGHRRAMVASVVAMIAGPAAILGLPFGIWALRVLNRREVREVFAHSRRCEFQTEGQTAETGWQSPTSGWGWLIGKIFGVTFTSRQAYRLANLSALGFLGCLSFLSYLPLLGATMFHALAGLFGLFGLIGAAFAFEFRARRKKASAMKRRVDDLGNEPIDPAKEKAEAPPAKSHSTGRMIAIGCGVLGLVGVLLMVALCTVFWLFTMKKHEAVERQAQAARQAEAIRAEAQTRQTKPGLPLNRHASAKAAEVFSLERGGPMGGVDLDIGKFVIYEPTGGIDDPYFADRWKEDHGIDLVLDRHSVTPAVLLTGTQVKEVAAEWWDDTPEAKVVEAVLPPWEKKSLFDERMTFLAAEGPSSGTRTHVCRTLAGSVGILRLGPTHSAYGVRAEWRMIVDRHPAEKAIQSVLIMLHPGREPILMGEQVSEESLKSKLASLKQANPDLAVCLKSDKRVSYDRITEMLDRLAKLGITNVSFSHATSPPQAESSADQAPQLRRLDWQDQVEACAGEAWLPSGEVDRSNDWMPSIGRVNISQTKAAKENPRFLCLWFSHPLFDRQSVTEISLLDADGKNSLELPTGEKAIGAIPAAPENANTGWITATLCAGKKGRIPPKATVILRYSGGAWQFWTEVAPDFRGTQSLANGVILSDPGQNSDGDAFIQITKGGSADEQFDFIAITRDGRRLERNGHGESSTGTVATERFSFAVPLSQVKSFECRKRPIHRMSWPVVLKETTDTSGKMKINFDRAGDSMQNILYNFRRQYDVRLCFENLDFDMKRDTITLGRRISMLEEKQRGGKLTGREAELLKDARRMRKEEKLGDGTVIDVGERYEGTIVAGSVEEFLNQLTKDTPYDWTNTDGKGTWVVRPRAGTRFNYPVTLDTAGLTVEEAVAKVIEQRPAGSEIGVGQVVSRPVAPGTDSDPWLHVKCKPAKIQGIPAWRALCVIGEGARPDSVWELAGYKQHRMLSLAPGPSMEMSIISEVQAWLLALDRGEYARGWETAAESFHTAVTKDQWDEMSEKIRKPLGEALSRKVSEARRMTTLPGMPDGSYFEVKIDSSFAVLKSAVETVTFALEKDGQWKAIAYLIKPAPRAEVEAALPPEKAVVATAETWLAGIDAGNYAQSWKDAAKFFQAAITEAAWSDALTNVRKPLGEMKSRKLLNVQSAKSLPGAPDGEYVVMQFDTSFAAKKAAVETVTFMLEKDGTWKATGYFIR